MSIDNQPMSDEDYLAHANNLVNSATNEDQHLKEPEVVEEEPEKEEQGQEKELKVENEETDEPSDEDGANRQGKEGEEVSDDKKSEEEKEEDLEQPKEEKDKKVEKTEQIDNNSTDYEDAGKKVLGEFKANGKVMQVKSADEAIKLMQMGANYHKKMSDLKPQLRTLHTLQAHGLDDEKLNIAIDLMRGDKKAIKQLLKVHKLDAMDLEDSDETDTDYTPSNYSLSETEYELRDAISNANNFNRIDKEVLGKWDNSSIQQFRENPKYITTLNQQIEDGTFDEIAKRMENQRMLGNQGTMSDLEFYCFIGQSYMQEQQQQSVVNTPPSTPKVVTQERVTNQEQKSKSSPASVAPTKTTKGSKTKVDIAKLSDEEFLTHAEGLINNG